MYPIDLVAISSGCAKASVLNEFVDELLGFEENYRGKILYSWLGKTL